MIRLDIQEAKRHLSRYLQRLEAGETIVLCKRNVPIAEIPPFRPRPAGPRPIGLSDGAFTVGDAFFDPLPADVLAAFDHARRARSSTGGS